MKKIILALLITSLTACSSLVDKGDKLYESGLYNEAADFYQRAIERDPDNIEARLGLNQTRYKIIDRGLIEVRMMRLSSNHTAAAEKLEQILRDESNWNIVLDGPITSTQAEETRYASYWLLKQAEVFANSSNPDTFRWFLYTYRQLIANGQLVGKLTTYHDAVWAKGKQQCQALVKDVKGQRFFLKEFTEKYCGAWNQSTNLKVDPQDNSRFKQLLPDIQLTQNLNRNQNQFHTINAGADSLNEQFRNSLWYSPMGSSALKLSIDGNVNYRHRQSRETRQANYTTDSKIVRKGEDGKDISETVSVNHTHPYIAFVHKETLALNLKYTSFINRNAISRSINKPTKKTSVAHNEELPAANLHPKKAKLMNITTVVAEQINQLNTGYLGALEQFWIRTYCDQTNHTSPSGEQIMRCGAAKPDDTYINNWFVQKWGIDYQQMAELYGLE